MQHHNTFSTPLKLSLRNSYILITGGTGFTGSHLTEHLSRFSKNVIVTYRNHHNDSYFSLQNLQKKVHVEKLDVRNKKALDNLIKKFPIEYIIHFAANTDVTDAYNRPYYTLDVNINGTVNILELARTTKTVKGTIIVSSDKAYGKSEKKVNELSSLAGDHPYEVAKSTADLIAQSYIKTYKLPIIITRFGNIYGPGDTHFERLIPGICKSLIFETPFIIRSNAKNIRHYVYIQDVVNAYTTLLNKFHTIPDTALNFASNDVLSTEQVIQLFQKVLKKKINYNITNIAVNEIPYQKLDITRAKKTGWKSFHTMESTIPYIFNWYQKFFS